MTSTASDMTTTLGLHNPPRTSGNMSGNMSANTLHGTLRRTRFWTLTGLFVLSIGFIGGCKTTDDRIQPGPRAATLAASLPEQLPLRDKLLSCQNGPFYATEFSIAHRGAPLGYPEHTAEGYLAAVEMGAGLVECDVTFTRDLALVCRHSQCDLHRTTNILQTPLAAQCRQPFLGADPATGQTAGAQCCTSDITLAEFKSLCGRDDFVDPQATRVDDYLIPRPSPVKTPSVACPTLMTHAESIALLDSAGVKFVPELKQPQVAMPFEPGFEQTTFADKLLAEYIAAGIEPRRVFPQSFSFADVTYWIAHHPAFAEQVVFLDPRGRNPDFVAQAADMQAMYDAGVRILAPPMPMLLTLDDQGELQPSRYARLAKQAGLSLVTWTLEAGSVTDPGNWMYANLPGYMRSEAQMLEVLDALAQKVGIRGIFSDWPGTVTYYANCVGLP